MMGDVGVEGGTVRGTKMVTSKVRRGVTTCFDAEEIAGEGYLSEVGSQCYFPSRREYLVPMR